MPNASFSFSFSFSKLHRNRSCIHYCTYTRATSWPRCSQHCCCTCTLVMGMGLTNSEQKIDLTNSDRLACCALSREKSICLYVLGAWCDVFISLGVITRFSRLQFSPPTSQPIYPPRGTILPNYKSLPATTNHPAST